MQQQISAKLGQLEKESCVFWQEMNPKAKSCLRLKKLLNLYATYDHWDKVINFSSRAVLHLNKEYERADFYYVWICALNETQDQAGLQDLSQHLLKMSQNVPVYKSLSILSNFFAGNYKESVKLIKEQKKEGQINNKFYREALGLILSSPNIKLNIPKFKNIQIVKRGLTLLKRNCYEKTSPYLTWRNYIKVLSQYNYLIEMSQAYNLMHENFPYSQEPYLVSALIAIEENDWEESIRILTQVLKDNPSNKDALLALIESYHENDDFQKSYNLLIENKKQFHEQDYDFNYLTAKILSKKFELLKDKTTLSESIFFYQKAIQNAQNLKFPIIALQAEKRELEIIQKQGKDTLKNEYNQNSISILNNHATEFIIAQQKYNQK